MRSGKTTSQSSANDTSRGALRIGLVQGASAGIFFVCQDTESTVPAGVTARLGEALAAELGRKPVFRLFHNSGECTAALTRADIDVAFMPVDEERKQLVSFGPAYYMLESTYLVTASSGLKTLADVDAPTVRVIGIADTTTIRASARTLARTKPSPVRSVTEAIPLLQKSEADAFALSRDALTPLVGTISGSRVLAGGFQRTGIAIAVPRERPEDLILVTQFLTSAKRSGLVRRLFDEYGFSAEAVAPE